MRINMKIFTIGFTNKSAEKFFNLLTQNNVIKVIDIRLNNKSQLAGFTKGNDLKFFLKKICNIEYIYMPELAPTKDLLDDYKQKKITWKDYEVRFNKLLDNTDIHKLLGCIDLNNSCLLCSEDKPDQCHRRLVAEKIKIVLKEFDFSINNI